MDDTQIKNNRRLLLALFILIIVVVAVVALLPKHKSKPPTTTPASTQTTTSYVGTDQLLSVGMTSYQLNDLKFAFHKYLTQFSQPFGQTIRITNVQHTQDANDNDIYSFTALVSSGTFLATFTGTDLDQGSLVLANQTDGAQIFDSGTITIDDPSTE